MAALPPPIFALEVALHRRISERNGKRCLPRHQAVRAALGVEARTAGVEGGARWVRDGADEMANTVGRELEADAIAVVAEA